jgi:hypothetical protein
MIIVLFPSGSFGSTIEYCLRQFSNELTKVDAVILENGSMHSYHKEFHPDTVKEFSEHKHLPYEIATPMYPNKDLLPPIESIKELSKFIDSNDKVIVIGFDTVAMAERNQLFSYHKTHDFLTSVAGDHCKSWNINYESIEDMQTYELRESVSFFIDCQPYYLDVHKNIMEHWMYITPDDILYNFKDVILKIIDHCNLTVNNSIDIDQFYQEWFSKQQYILKEFNTVNTIIDSIKSDSYFEWEELSIVGEAIVQSRLRKLDMELACYNLNKFPTKTSSLREFIIIK